MSTAEPSESSDAEPVAHAATDRLATALEEVGFDVGRDFPWLRGVLNIHNAPVVDIGRISTVVAARLAKTLSDAARQGIDA